MKLEGGDGSCLGMGRRIQPAWLLLVGLRSWEQVEGWEQQGQGWGHCWRPFSPELGWYPCSEGKGLLQTQL